MNNGVHCTYSIIWIKIGETLFSESLLICLVNFSRAAADPEKSWVYQKVSLLWIDYKHKYHEKISMPHAFIKSIMS